jgi:transposase
MENWSEIRRRVLVEGVSRRQILRETGMHWRTLRKMLKHSEPPGYQQSKPRTKTKLEAYVGRIEQILKEDQAMPRKQRHTAKRISARLKEEHVFTGGYTILKDYVRDARLRHKEVFVPLAHPPGDAQADFGEALVVIGGWSRRGTFCAWTCRIPTTVSWRLFRRRRRKPFWRGMQGPSPISAAGRARSSTTTPRSPLGGSWAMGHG